MGFTDGQNGAGWPAPLKDPLGNNNRAGFYLTQVRVKGTVPFDSTFSAVFVGNAIYLDPQEAYVEKHCGIYSFKAGKFRGAGPKSGSGTDEFERIAINAPRYARLEDYYMVTLNFRDFGVQAERDGSDGNLVQRFFLHNGNRLNLVNDEPSFPTGAKATQALAVDYALDWRVSPFTVLGGHVGALADKEWSDFIGKHEGWQAGYWFKTNPAMDASLYQQMDFTKLHILNEALIISNRTLPNPVDSAATQSWGVSSMLRLDHSAHWGYFFRYEFMDPSDGYYRDDNLQMFTLGAIFKPSPDRYPGLKVTGEYVRSLEEGARNTIPDDNLFVQLQMVF